MKQPLLLLGDEAIAQAALDAGVSGGYAYPGTPSTEILEYIRQSAYAAEHGIHREWSANEKTAMEAALGMSYAGKRALVSMKHVGLNVAADPFINTAITGVNGGLVVAVADDPSMHSSQNEQDSRFYADFAGIPLLEPSSQQEAYDMVRLAFDFSEQTKLPILLRITTRLAHSRADVFTRPPVESRTVLPPSEDRRRFVLLPANARANYDCLVAQQPALRAAAEQSEYNKLYPGDGSSRELGIVAAGIAWNYLMEWFNDNRTCPYPVLRIGQYPFPATLFERLAAACDRILVLEEGMPLIESRLAGPGSRLLVSGRLDGRLPRTGELNPEAVARALGIPTADARPASHVVVPRPPMLCKGCPHIDSYNFLTEVMQDTPEGRVFSDIGCYTLGALPPFEAIATCVDMGASISMAKGAADAGLHPSVAVIGDSTFTHSGITSLLDAVYENSRITVVILDNETTGMTGGQPSHATGRLESIVTGLGVDPQHVLTVVPLKKNHDENTAVLRREIEHHGLSVIIARRGCIQVGPRKQ